LPLIQPGDSFRTIFLYTDVLDGSTGFPKLHKRSAKTGADDKRTSDVPRKMLAFDELAQGRRGDLKLGHPGEID